MQIVKLNAIDSTNAYIKRTLRTKGLETNTVVVADEQYEGRGQMGTIWSSEPGKNLTFSILKKFDSFKISEQFYLSMLVCLSIYKTLKDLNIPDLSIKWPNDILSGNDKFCGVLIETIIKGDTIRTAILGIGLNVNQTRFPDLAKVTSLKLLLGKSFDLDELLQKLLEDLMVRLQNLSWLDLESLRSDYEKKLFMKDKPAFFEFKNGTKKEGCIQGISKDGKLRIQFKIGIQTEFAFKELKLIY